MPRIEVTSAPTTELHVEDVGEGRPVVLIHGWPLSHRMWEYQINALVAAGFRAIAYDRRGFGESGRPGAGYDYDTLAGDLRDVMETLDLRDAVLVGFSMGGGEVARYVRRYGTARVAATILVAAVTPGLARGGDNPDGLDPAVFDGMIGSVKGNRLAFLDGFFRDFYATGADGGPVDLVAYSKWIAWAAAPWAMVGCISAFGTTDFTRDMASFDVPTLIVHGDSDRIVPAEIAAQRAHAMVAGSQLAIIEGAPHGLAMTHPEELNPLMLDFLRG
jgi:non-heme chloroperoxidase